MNLHRRRSAEPRALNGAQALVAALEAEGCSHVFGYPGGAIMPVYDALRDSAVEHVLVRHEQAAALAADAWGRLRGEPGVCIATSGPGATNLVTGIANAAMDSAPLVAITGQVPSQVLGTDAFQEIDVFGLTMPIVKHSYLVRDAGEVAATVHEAFALAREGRPGPVLIDLPKDVQLGPAGPLSAGPRPRRRAEAVDPIALVRALDALAAAERPLIYAGGGVAMAGAVEAFRAFVESSGIPCVTTLKGLGLLPREHDAFVGMLGMHGTTAANASVQACDLLVVVGARFDDRATMNLRGFAPNARVIHLDVDPGEVGKLREADVRLLGDMTGALRALARPRSVAPWRDRCRARKAAARPDLDHPGPGVFAPRLLDRISVAFGDELILACDVGQHQMWVAQHCRIPEPRAHLTSGGLGTMGYGLPAAIGAALAEPGRRVLCVTGDGSIMMNLQELATVRRYALPIKILLLDNACLGLVRQWQELFFDGRYSEIDLSDNPDFVEVAHALGIPGFRIDRAEQEREAVERLLAADGPMLCHCVIDPRENVWPLVPPGESLSTQMLQP